MKNLSKILLVGAVVLTMILPLSANTRPEGGDPVSGKSKKLFVFKATRKFVGAKVEVRAADGHVLTTQTMQKRKMFIDFSDVTEGVYTIRISKGDEVKEFQFNKN